jgi:hypothetical protein
MVDFEMLFERYWVAGWMPPNPHIIVRSAQVYLRVHRPMIARGLRYEPIGWWPAPIGSGPQQDATANEVSGAVI